jgi:DNA-binding NarL/FixJ family response regulator
MSQVASPIRVMIVDDHPIIRDGLKAILSAKPDLLVVAEASTGEEVLECYKKAYPAVIICDLLLPDVSGAEVINCRSSQRIYANLATSLQYCN